MTESSQQFEEQAQIVDQSDDVRDPADDSDEFNDPTLMADTYPAAFDDKIAEAEAAIESHDPMSDRRHGGGNG